MKEKGFVMREELPGYPGEPILFAWCFDHGTLHRFVDRGFRHDGVWCTAAWVELEAETTDEALCAHVAKWGGVQFFHQLSTKQQLEVLALEDARKELREQQQPGGGR
jgi:hypothetical protein